MTKKTQKKLRKALLLISCAALLVCITVGVTVAYLTDTKSVKNTFSVGKVEIALDEATVTYNEETNKYVDAGDRTTDGNSYKLLPGTEIYKDPTVTVKAGSEESYIRMLITVTNISGLKAAFPSAVAEDGTFLLQNFIKDWNTTNWSFVKVTAGTEADTAVYEFRYNDVVDTLATDTVAAADKTLEKLFTTIMIPGETDGDALAELTDGVEINVVAQAMQADGFTTADLAWADFHE